MEGYLQFPALILSFFFFPPGSLRINISFVALRITAFSNEIQASEYYPDRYLRPEQYFIHHCNNGQSPRKPGRRPGRYARKRRAGTPSQGAHTSSSDERDSRVRFPSTACSLAPQRTLVSQQSYTDVARKQADKLPPEQKEQAKGVLANAQAAAGGLAGTAGGALKGVGDTAGNTVRLPPFVELAPLYLARAKRAFGARFSRED